MTFFAENGLKPKRENRDGFEISSAGGIEIWRGDFFKIESRHLAGIAGVYDRASLIALPTHDAAGLCRQMAELVPRGVPTLLVAFNYDQSQAPGPPFATPPEHVRRLFGDGFEIGEIESKDVLSDQPEPEQARLELGGGARDPAPAALRAAIRRPVVRRSAPPISFATDDGNVRPICLTWRI